jgi:hypothetical protein
MLRNLRRPAIFLLNPAIDLFAVHPGGSGRIDPQLDLVAFDLQHPNADIIADDDPFLDSSR